MELPMEDRDRFARGVYPRGWPAEPSLLHAECLVEGIDPSIEVTVRLLQRVERLALDAAGCRVGRLEVAGAPYESRIEAIEHELRIPSLPGRTAAIETAGEKRAALTEKGKQAGTLVWRWEPLHATVEAWTEELDISLHRVRVEVANRLEWDAASDEAPATRAFYAAQVFLHSPNGTFTSLTDPPPHLREHSAASRNEGLWPVPVDAGDRHTMLASQVPDAARRVA
jgi:hypothetical protein